MGRASKDKRDIYYRKAKEEGYRARSAYKLLQINEAVPLFENIQSGVVDLCAAPGSWSQVIARVLRGQQDQINEKLLLERMTTYGSSEEVVCGADSLPPPSPVISVDLQEMAPIEGVTLLQGDITSEATANEIIRLLTEAASSRQRAMEALQHHTTSTSIGSSSALACKADLVVCDGAPDVTGLHELDEYLQHHLLLAALHITSHLLRPGGTFVTKSVRILKPMSSRNASMECFMLCEGFQLPSGYTPTFPSALATPSVSTDCEEAARQRRRLEEEPQHSALGLSGTNYRTSTAPEMHYEVVGNSQTALLSFLACGDLSGYDADMCYPREQSAGSSLPPVQPPLQAPYLTNPTT